MDYIKLSALVGDTFTVDKVWGYKWKSWDNDNKKMLVSDTYVQGYKKAWELDTNKGKLELSSSQIGSCLESVLNAGVADLIGKTLMVKSNNKTGMDIRYFFNAQTEPKAEKIEKVTDIYTNTEIDISNIPF